MDKQQYRIVGVFASDDQRLLQAANNRLFDRSYAVGIGWPLASTMGGVFPGLIHNNTTNIITTRTDNTMPVHLRAFTISEGAFCI